MTSTTLITSTRTPSAVARQFRRDNTYLLAALPVATVAYVVVLSMTLLSGALLPLWIGLPMLAVALRVASAFTAIERVRLRALGMTLPTPRCAVRRSGWRGWTDGIRDRRSWLDVLHAVVTFPVAVLTWSLTIGWWAAALGGLSYPLWSWTLPDGPDNQNLAELIGITSSAGDIALQLGLGLVFAATIVPLVRGLAGLQSGLSRAMLAPEQVGSPGPRAGQ